MASWAPHIDQSSGSEALAPTDMMYLVYTLVRIRPVAPDSFIVQRIKDMQHFKGLEMDAVLLQFWLAGLTGLAEANTSQQRMIWKSLVLVKIPSIISHLGSDYGEITTLVGSTLRQLSFYRSILDECDECLSEDTSLNSDILLSIAIGCRARGLVRSDQLSILEGHTPAINDLDKYSFGKSVYMFNTMEIIEDLCGRILSDFELQEALVDRIITVCEEASASSDVSTLSKLCQTLDDNPLVLDLIHLLRSPSALLAPLEGFVNHLQQNEDDDIDSCNSNLEGLGVVLVLIMTIIRRYELGGCLGSLLVEKNGFCYLWLHRTSATISSMSLSTMHPEMQALMGRWISALFDSMGISDDLIQTSKPQMLLEIAPSIFEQSLAACQAGIIDATTLNSGLDYFLQPCLLFVLVGVVQYLCEEILSSSSTTYSSTPAKMGHQHRSGSISAGHSTVSPASGGHTVSPLANRGMKPSHPPSSTHASHGGSLGTTGKSAASMLMLQSSLKSLLAGEAFPPRLMRLLKNEISSALDHPAMEQDHQLTQIHEKLAAATVNDYSWSDTETYDVSKLSQQASLAFEAIVSGGRTPLVNKKEKGWPVFGGSSYHIDVDLFRTTLCFLGPAQFDTIILKQVLKAALTTHGRRAVELGAAIITTPLMGCGDPHLSPQSLLWTLFYRTLWIPVPGRLETFSQGLLFATFVGMTLDMFQSQTFIQMNEKKERQQKGKNSNMEVDARDPASAGAIGDATLPHGKKGTEDELSKIQDRLERDAAMEPFRIMMEERLQELTGMVQDRPGFEGFLQGVRQYRQRHPPMANLVQSRKVTGHAPSRLAQKTLSL